MAQSNVFNCDCVEYMKTLPDNFFDLCIADPPYGDGTKNKIGGGICKEKRKVRGEVQEKLPTNWKRFSGGTWAERYRKPIMPTEGVSPDTPTWGGGVEIPKWDVAPGEEYFKEMFRVSRNQITLLKAFNVLTSILLFTYFLYPLKRITVSYWT